MPDSRHPRPHVGSPVVHEFVCSDCGTTFLSSGSTCPVCRQRSLKKSEDEMTKKVVDDNDLKKGF